VHDATALSALLAGADAVVNLVAILHGSAAEFERTHVALPRTHGRGLPRRRRARLVHVSALGVATDAPSLYLRSKAAGERVLQDSGLALTLLRPSVIFGAEDRFLNLFADLQRAGAGAAAGGRDGALPAGVGGRRGRGAGARSGRAGAAGHRMRRPAGAHAVGPGAPGRPLVGARAAADRAARRLARCRPR
jgi:uncharacterized protein YbjT (DUF2867 family)